MQQLSCQQKLKPWMGFALFAVLMALFIFVCGPMQEAWGIWGLIATEAIFLILAIAYALILRVPLKEMFPIKKFKARDFFGSLFLVVGGIQFGLISVAVSGIIYPSALEGGDVQAISEFIGGDTGYIFTMFAMALVPAICEEAIHRGAIISNFRSIKKEWIIVLIMGLFFGIFHMSALRFINTAIMGACLSYIVVKKNNMLLSSLMHFILNLGSSTISYVSGKLLNASGTGGTYTMASQMTVDNMKNVLGSYLMTGLAAPFLIVIGLMLLNPSAHKKIRFLFAGIITAVMLISSVAITVSNSTGSNVLLQTSMSYTVQTENEESLPLDLKVDTSGDYTVAVVIMNSKGEYSVRIEKDNGETVSDKQVPSGVLMTYTDRLSLESGNYRIIIVSGKDTVGEHPSISVQVNKG